MSETPTIQSCACGNPVCVQQSKVMRVTHGHYSMYTNHKCRCAECREAYRVYRQRYRKPKVTACGCGNANCQRRTRREVTHGLSCYFRHKCRCGVCMTAMRNYQRERRARLRAETRQRREALVASISANDLTGVSTPL